MKFSRSCSSLVTPLWPSPNPRWSSRKRTRLQSRTGLSTDKRKARTTLQARERPRTQATPPQKPQKTSPTWTLIKAARRLSKAERGAGCFRLRCSLGEYLSLLKCFRNCTQQSKSRWLAHWAQLLEVSLWHSMPSLFLDDIIQKPAAISLFDKWALYTWWYLFLLCALYVFWSVSQYGFNKVIEKPRVRSLLLWAKHNGWGFTNVLLLSSGVLATFWCKT